MKQKLKIMGITGECAWKFTGVPGNYTLTISGNGTMGNYDNLDDQRPWQYRQDIKTIVIQDGVTTIGDYAFYECSGLTSVSISNSVTTIGKSAFSGCSGLTSVSISNSVTTIGNYAFRGCRGLTSVTIGSSVTAVSQWIFFYECRGLTDIHVDAANAKYSSENGVLFNKDKTKLIYCPRGKTGNYSIPNSVTTIGYADFSGRSSLISVIIGNSVKTIGDWAFEGCHSLITITIGNSVETIGNYAFRDCSGLTSVTIPNSVETIGESAFENCYSLPSVTIPNSVKTIGGSTFEDCSSLTAIHVDAANAQYSSENGILFNKDKTKLIYCPRGKTGSYYIPNSITSIGYVDFSECNSLTSVTIPNSVKTIGSGTFEDCSSLTAIYVDAANAQYSSENGVLFNKDKTILVCYPRGKTGSYVIPNSVKTIGCDAFSECSGLTSVIIGNSVKTIGDWAFEGCHSLITVTIGNSVETISESAFSYCRSLTSVTIPNSVETIGESAFNGCSDLTSVTNLSATPQNVDNYVFSNINTRACILKVPASAVNTYRAVPVWRHFGNIVANE